MTSKISSKLLWIFIIIVAIALTSCENEVYSPLHSDNSSETLSPEYLAKGKGKNKGKPKDDDPVEDPIVDPEPDPFVTTYQLFQADDSDPLFRFSISESGELMLLETNPEVTSWGTNYWGYWSDPFLYENDQVNYIIGLTNTTYQFKLLHDNKIEVTKTLIVQPYPSGEPTTTITRPGVYILTN